MSHLWPDSDDDTRAAIDARLRAAAATGDCHSPADNP